MAAPTVPADALTYTQAVAAGFWGKRTDPVADQCYGPVQTPPAPVIGSVAPNSGPLAGGTALTIGGSGFTGAYSVAFGKAVGTAFTVTDATHIAVTTPAGVGRGPVDVTISGPGGVCYRTRGFQYT